MTIEGIEQASTSEHELEIRDGTVAGPHGEIPVRIYLNTRSSVGTGLVWLHGGAFIGGSLDMQESDWVARQVAEAGILVVTVDYRLAPTPDWMVPYVPANPDGWRFPGASEEATAAFLWATDLDATVPAGRWALGGASAGGNLAAGAALRLRDAGGPMPSALVLAYPLVHKELPAMSAELQAKIDGQPVQERFSPETVTLLNQNYVGDAALLDDQYAFPGGHDLSGLPPTLIVNSDIDSLRASGQHFASELAVAGVDITVIREPGNNHGHLDRPDSDGAQRTMQRIRAWIIPALTANDFEGSHD
jgi:acetyl esterase/lipase